MNEPKAEIQVDLIVLGIQKRAIHVVYAGWGREDLMDHRFWISNTKRLIAK